MAETLLYSGTPLVSSLGKVAVTCVEVNPSNIDDWKDKIYEFASTLALTERCNAEAVAANRLQLTYPSVVAIQDFVAKDASVTVAHNSGNVCGYMICVEDHKHGGCQCKWIGYFGPSAATIYADMADIACARWGWLWGRVTNTAIRELMIQDIPGCELGIPDDPEIVTYKKP